MQANSQTKKPVVIVNLTLAEEVIEEKNDRAFEILEKKTIAANERSLKATVKELRVQKAMKRSIKPSNRKGNKAQQRAAWLFEADED